VQKSLPQLMKQKRRLCVGKGESLRGINARIWQGCKTACITYRFFCSPDTPNIGRTRDQDLRPGLRSFPIANYLLIYRVEEEDVLILRVLHGSWDIEVLFGR
jgi:ParE toxin of type II toxin-antitoxin system, parDE